MDEYKISGSIDDIILTTIDGLDLTDNMGTTTISSLDSQNYGDVILTTGAATSTGLYSNSWSSPYTITGIDTVSNSNGLHVHGDAEFEGDIKVKGKSLNDFMETLEKRLAILQPDPEKLEKFEALQKAYAHYKTLEALCEVQKDEDEE